MMCNVQCAMLASVVKSLLSGSLHLALCTLYDSLRAQCLHRVPKRGFDRLEPNRYPRN